MKDKRYEAFKNTVEEALKELLPTHAEHGGVIFESMRYSLLAGGKRLRPILLLATMDTLGADIQQGLRTACALECVHTYSLIHDDLPGMDNDDLRRGMPTNHIQFNEGIAILAGDALLTEAFGFIARDLLGQKRGELGLRLVEELAAGAGAQGMVIGQMADIEAEQKHIDASHLAWIHRHKTGALIRASVRMGALLADADDESLDGLTGYAEKLGLAFQIVDDILDEIGDTEVLGKPAGSDQALEKSTYVSLYGLEEAQRLAKQAVGGAQMCLKRVKGDTAFLHDLAEYVLMRQK